MTTMAGRAFAQPKKSQDTQREQAAKEAPREDIQGTPVALEEQIRRRAHEIYMHHGGHGQSAEADWLQAEHEIRNAKTQEPEKSQADKSQAKESRIA